MKIAIATVQVPYITGGAEILVGELKKELINRGHSVEIVTIPFKWYPSETLVNCMLMGRMMDVTEVNGEKIDLLIATKFPAYYSRHRNKVFWLMHQHRQAYDFWDTPYSDIQQWENGRDIRDLIINNDNKYIPEAKKIFTIANNTSNRLKKFNNIDSVPLYHPPQNHEKLYCKEYGDFVFYPSRIDQVKRQRLLVEAARFLKTDTKIYLAGGGSKNEIDYLHGLIKKYNLSQRVQLLGFISEEQKIEYYAGCLGVYFGAYDEDYGYITLEAFFSKKPVIVHPDSGGPLEFVDDGFNGHVVNTDPETIANTIDHWANDKQYAQKLGNLAYEKIIEMNISWDYVIDELLKN